MRDCEAPLCSYQATRGSAYCYCYFHDKVSGGLIRDLGTETGRSLHARPRETDGAWAGHLIMGRLRWDPRAPDTSAPRSAIDILRGEWGLPESAPQA